MGSEKSGPKQAAFSFVSRQDANRRVAGVALAARVARRFAEGGGERLWLTVPGGGSLEAAATEDIARLAGRIEVRIVAPEGLPPGIEPAPAPSLSAGEVLKATGKAGDGPVSRWLNRPLSRLVSAAVLLIPGVRPLHATLCTAVVAALMFSLLATGDPEGLLAGGILFQAASVLDGVDGEIARATFRATPAGAALDTVVDLITNLLFVLGVTLNIADTEGFEAAAVGGWGFVLFAVGLAMAARGSARAGGAFTLELVKRRYRAQASRPAAAFLVRFGTIVTSRDFFALLFALLIVAGQPMAVLYIFAAAATVWILFVAGGTAASGPGEIV